MERSSPGTRPAGMARWLALASLVGTLLAATLAGCSSTPLDEPASSTSAGAPTTAATGGAGTPGGAAANATPQSRVATVDLTGAGGADAADAALGAAAQQRVIYFDYDSFAIKDAYQAMLVAHARALAANPKAHLVVEGNTDERGGSEYNLALGQKRAEAVMRVLILLGAPAGQLEAVSFGEERPAVEGHDEAAWAQNRRVELKDR